MGLDVDNILKSKGLTRSKLAELLGSNRSYVTNALKNPTLETLGKFANALDVDIRELFTPKSGEVLINGFIEYNGATHRIKSIEDLRNFIKVNYIQDLLVKHVSNSKGE
jgi:transcriptional regulator with XRE-family HTH domain